MAGRLDVTAFAPAGYNPPGAFDVGGDGSANTAKPYAIPPFVWMLLFLFLGYVGIRLLVED